MKRVPVLALLLALLAAGASQSLQAQPVIPNTDFRVKLLGPLNAKTSQKGDQVTAQVRSPEEFRDAIMEGKVTEAKSSGKIKGESVLNFTFETLHLGQDVVPVETQVKSITNSKGQVNVDEEGRSVKKTNNIGKAAVGTGLGALIGGLAGGAKGAAIGAGVGAAASIVMIKMTVKGNNVEFAPGTQFILAVKQRRHSGDH